jgi:general secretion pathway protein D
VKVKFVKSIVALSILCGTHSVLAQTAPANPEPTYTVQFKDTDILDVVKYVGEVTGKTIIVDPKVRGPVKVISNKPLNKKELYELFLAVLDVNSFTAVDSGGVVRIVANRDARNMAIPTEQKIGSRDDGYITQIIQLNNISASKVLAAIRPLVPQYGHLAVYEPSNALIISDTRANIARINELIEQMDKAAVIATDVIPLRYAQATEVVAMISQLEKPDPARGVTTSPPVVVADKRINAVIVNGDEMSRQRIRVVVESLDRVKAKNANLKVIYLSYAKAADVAKVLTGMLQSQQGKAAEGAASGAANVQADESTNSVLITADGDTMQSLLAVVDSLDIRRAQVLVEAIIVEVQDTGKKELGVQWAYRNHYGSGFGGSGNGGDDSKAVAGVGGAAINLTNEGFPPLVGALTGQAGQTFGLGRIADGTDFFGLLKMLREDSGANILSTPNILTTDNTKALISIGQKIPFKTGSYSGASGGGGGGGGLGGGGGSFSSPFNTINRESVGLKLEVTPHINEGDSVVLDIKQEVSGIFDKNNSDGPITDERKIETQILTGDGQTVVLGGLIKDDVQTSTVRVPFLGSIPVVGRLFRSEKNTKLKTNLLVFIRATVIRDDKVLEGATAEKYLAIRNAQLESRRTAPGANAKSIPVLPEWKTRAEKSKPRKSTQPEDSSTQSESVNSVNRESINKRLTPEQEALLKEAEDARQNPSSLELPPSDVPQSDLSDKLSQEPEEPSQEAELAPDESEPAPAEGR